MRALLLAPLGLALLVAACGETTGERATTGAAGGAVTGAAIGGPVGAVVGGGVGAAGGAYRPEVDQKTNEVAQNATSTTSGSTAQNRRARGAAASSGGVSHDQVRQAQTALQKAGYYHGKIDGLYGPQTRAAVRDYQAKENLSQTGRLDRTTMQHLRNVASNSGAGSGSASPSSTSGSSMPSSSSPSATSPNAGSSPANSGPNAPGGSGSSSGTSAGEPQTNR
ncbi:MAG TPA: peptidoglycan-binding domain-containing protein [Alphaproteobacteria bacterium]|jgi:osmotically inducible lipoprotein OsmB|nr:peptidoglycan-binding domain-containing protein [Alphaproteobacteria bacterium]